MDSDRGWLGQSEDASTKLSYLNARYYDATAAVFVSPDPLYDLGRPKSLNPYAYSHGNPATNSDPSGLEPRINHNRSTTMAQWRASYKGVDGYGTTPATRNRPTQRAERARDQARAANHAATARATLSAMCSANCDPGFWQALNNAGSAGSLTLVAMYRDNPDPGFWQALPAIVLAREVAVATAEALAASMSRGYDDYNSYRGGGHLERLAPTDVGPNEQDWCTGVGWFGCSRTMAAAASSLMYTNHLVGQGRLTVDEGNAMRHALWMGYAAFYTSEESAYELGIELRMNWIILMRA